MSVRDGVQENSWEALLSTTPWLRRAALAAMDVASWALALGVIVGVRLDFTITTVEWASVVRYGLTVGVLMVGLGYATKFYRGRFLVGSFDEALGLALHIGAVAVVALLVAPLLYPTLPRSIPVLVP